MEKFSIVTGGASGLGFAFVKLLLIDKYNVVIVDNDFFALKISGSGKLFENRYKIR